MRKIILITLGPKVK